MGIISARPGSSTAPEIPVMDTEEFRHIAHIAVDIAADYLGSIEKRLVFKPMQPSDRQSLLEAQMPDSGISAEGILDQFKSRIMPYPMGNGHPRFFGWVNSPPAPMGIIAEFLAARHESELRRRRSRGDLPGASDRPVARRTCWIRARHRDGWTPGERWIDGLVDLPFGGASSRGAFRRLGR
jgi:hypothetical protein